MPKINMQDYENATASTGSGEFQRMGAGGYVVQIQAVRTEGKDGYGRIIDYVGAKDYVKLVYDIAEGDLAGKFKVPEFKKLDDGQGYNAQPEPAPSGNGGSVYDEDVPF